MTSKHRNRCSGTLWSHNSHPVDLLSLYNTGTSSLLWLVGDFPGSSQDSQESIEVVDVAQESQDGGAGSVGEGGGQSTGAATAAATADGQVRRRQLGMQESMSYGGPVRIQPEMKKNIKRAQALYVACGANSILSVECKWLTRLIQTAMDVQRELVSFNFILYILHRKLLERVQIPL